MIRRPTLQDLEADSQAKPHRLLLPRPYAPWQDILINTNVKLAVFALGTKVGKTLGASIRISKNSFLAEKAQDAYFRILAPYYRHSEITYKYLNRILPSKLPYDQNMTKAENERAKEEWAHFTPRRTESKRRMIWPHNNALIECIHGQDPAAIEGERCHGVLIDEAAKLKEASFGASMTTTSQTGGWHLLTSTPVGKNWFYKVGMECKDEEEWCLKRGLPPTKIFRTVPTWSSPFVNKEIVENARKTMPDRLFRQLYGGEFIDDGSVFMGISEFFNDASPNDFESVDYWMCESHNSRSIFVGADWAKKGDFTVLIAIGEDGKMLGFKRMQKYSYTIQVANLFAFCDTLTSRNQDGLNCHVSILHDETGVGDAVRDIIDASPNPNGYDVKGIIWGNANKEVFVNDLILSLEEFALRSPPINVIRHELQIFEVTTTKTGKPSYAAPEGEHDDTVMSLVLANALWRENSQFTSGVVLVDNLARQVEYIHYSMYDIDELT